MLRDRVDSWADVNTNYSSWDVVRHDQPIEAKRHYRRIFALPAAPGGSGCSAAPATSRTPRITSPIPARSSTSLTRAGRRPARARGAPLPPGSRGGTTTTPPRGFFTTTPARPGGRSGRTRSVAGGGRRATVAATGPRATRAPSGRIYRSRSRPEPPAGCAAKRTSASRSLLGRASPGSALALLSGAALADSVRHVDDLVLYADRARGISQAAGAAGTPLSIGIRPTSAGYFAYIINNWTAGIPAVTVEEVPAAA